MHARLLLTVVFCALPLLALGQGALTPPAAPAPLFKTLQQVEPRIDLQNAPPAAVVTSNPSYHFIINAPGSYYLSDNLGVTKTNGILINAEGVTLDLRGFEINRASGSGGNGVEISATAHRSSVRNGSIQSFAYGIATLSASGTARASVFRDLTVGFCANGILAGTGAVLESCRAHNCSMGGIFTYSAASLSNCTAVSSGTYGINAGSGSSLRNCAVTGSSGGPSSIALSAGYGSSLVNCTATDNTVTAGIFAGDGSSLDHCTVRNTTGIPDGFTGRSYGINVRFGSALSHCVADSNTVTCGIQAEGSTLSHCNAARNTWAGSLSYGIYAQFESTLIGCIATSNTNTNETPDRQSGAGIFADRGSTVKDCISQQNKGNGITLGARCVVEGSNSSSNGLAGVGAGIDAGIRTFVSNCSANQNRGDGILVLGESVVTGSRASANGQGVSANGINSSGGSGSRIEGNQARDNNGTGILASAGDVVIRNTAGNNSGGNFNPSSGTNFGTLQSPNAATNPLANVQF